MGALLDDLDNTAVHGFLACSLADLRKRVERLEALQPTRRCEKCMRLVPLSEVTLEMPFRVCLKCKEEK